MCLRSPARSVVGSGAPTLAPTLIVDSVLEEERKCHCVLLCLLQGLALSSRAKSETSVLGEMLQRSWGLHVGPTTWVWEGKLWTGQNCQIRSRPPKDFNAHMVRVVLRGWPVWPRP